MTLRFFVSECDADTNKRCYNLVSMSSGEFFNLLCMNALAYV